jgi:hypothetical protein
MKAAGGRGRQRERLCYRSFHFQSSSLTEVKKVLHFYTRKPRSRKRSLPCYHSDDWSTLLPVKAPTWDKRRRASWSSRRCSRRRREEPGEQIVGVLKPCFVSRPPSSSGGWNKAPVVSRHRLCQWHLLQAHTPFPPGEMGESLVSSSCLSHNA